MKKYLFWIIFFASLLALIPVLIYVEQLTLAKIVGILTILSFSFALRRWLFLAKKNKGRADKINLNANDRYFLEKEIVFYEELSSADKRIFEDRITLFLTDIIVTEIDKEVPDRETCLLVAASAVITFWGLPYWNYGKLSEVLVYPSHFNEDNSLSSSGRVMGKVHHGGLMDTTMILSLPALKHGFRNTTDKKNVGVHEFAHMLDKADGEIDGLPHGINEDEQDEWIALFETEMKAIMNGKSKINAYGAESVHEFFAVAVEYYKEQPELMQKKHKKLFETLNTYFNDL